jgi:hypothetical protein
VQRADAAGLQHLRVLGVRGEEGVDVLLQDLLQAAQRRGLAGLSVEGEEGRAHRAEQQHAPLTIAASVGHGPIGRVELVDRGPEPAGVVVLHGPGVVLGGRRRQAFRRLEREEQEQGEGGVHRDHGRWAVARSA